MKEVFFVFNRALHLVTGQPKACRFFPTCSQYSEEAFREFTFFKAVRVVLVRVLKCAPWHSGGWDPVLK